MNEDHIAAAEIGEEAKKFMESELGQVILGMAKQDALLAMEALAEVDPTSVEKIRVLQNTVYLSNTFEQWLKELISKGDNAIDTFRQQQET